MSTLAPLLRTKTTAAWFVLIVATISSWFLGTDHQLASADAHTVAGVAILLIAFAKTRLIGLYFMELRAAPLALRGFFEGYCVLVCGLVVGMYLLV